MRFLKTLSFVSLTVALAVGLSACGKKVVTPVPVTNENANGNENTNVAVPDVSGEAGSGSAGNGNANGNENTNGNTNGNVNIPVDANVNGSADLDSDGLTNDQERLYKTDPLNPDTDGDGYKDGAEIATGYDPTKVAEEDAKVISQLKPVQTPGIPAPIARSTALKAVQSFPFRATKADGQVTIRLESRTATSIVNFAVDYAGGVDNHGPSLSLDNKYTLLGGTFDKGKVWITGRDFVKGPHYMTTSNTVGTLTLFPAPTPPFFIDGRGEGGIEDAASILGNTFVADFPKSGQYRFEFNIIRGRAKIAVENSSLVLKDKVYPEVDTIKSVVLTADVAEGLHTITITGQETPSWSLRVSKT
ncbi:MAG: hypothetical protein AAB424_02490 [Patescibacteria group bacterium]